MPRYRYSAINHSGTRISGAMEAGSREVVIRELSDAGHFPIEAAVEGQGEAIEGGSFAAWRSVSAGQITQFTRQLAMLLSSGLTLPRAMGLIEQEAGASRLARIARQIRADLAGGKSLAEALETRRAQFPLVYVSMVRAAEASGTLPDVLERIAVTREREQRIRSKLISALLYPALLIAVSIAALLVIMVFVVPRFKSMLVDSGAKLPGSAAAVIAASDWLNAHLLTLAVSVLVLAAAVVLLRRRVVTRRLADRLSLRMPLIGRLVRMDIMIRFCRMLGALLANGVDLPTALGLVRDVMGNAEASAVVAAMCQELRKGSDLAKPMENSHLFPPIVVALIRVGEETGKLAKSAEYLAQMFDERLEIATQRLVTILEPVIIIAVSGVVATIIISIMGAVVSVYDLAF